MIKSSLEWYYSLLEDNWKTVPSWIKPCVVSLSVFILGITIKGEWILLFVHFLNQFGCQHKRDTEDSDTPLKWFTLKHYRLQGLPTAWLLSVLAGFGIWFGVGGFLQDYLTYWAHRMYHSPWLYPHFHKIHHRFKAPTCWSVTSFHPFEIFTMQLVLASPLYFLPLHWTSFTSIGIYIYYNAILDHSGVDIKAPRWQFWKPDSIFHDNHHQYTHVNFGFNCYYWDLIHGTYRKTDRIYNENIFYGNGKSLTQATRNELDNEFKERMAENPKAHRRLKNVLLKE